MSKKLIVLLLPVALLTLPAITFADASSAASTWFNMVICNFLTIVVWPIFIGAAIVMIIYTGYKFLTAQGDSTKLTEAKKALIWSIVGIIVAILAFSVVGVIDQVLNAGSTTTLSCPGGSSTTPAIPASSGGPGSDEPGGGATP